MRALLFQLSLAAAAVACNNSSDAPKVAASATAAAGRVIEVSGTVTVAGKQLARGDTVAADAIIETGADGSVAIELVHNHVRWDLGANKKVRVRDSLAWGQPMRIDPSGRVEQPTLSGGRPAERMAADTTTTAGGEREREAAPADKATGGTQAATEDKADTEDRADVDTKAAKADKVDANEVAKAAGGTSGGTSGAQPLDAPKPKGAGLGVTGTGKGGGGTGGGTGLGDVGTIGHGAGTVRGGGHKSKAPSIRQGQAEIIGRLAPEVVQRIVRQHFAQLKFCYEKALHDNPSLAGKVVVKFVIDRSGAVSNAQDAGSTLGDQAVVACVAKAFTTFKFPEPEGGIVTVTYPIVFSPGD